MTIVNPPQVKILVHHYTLVGEMFQIDTEMFMAPKCLTRWLGQIRGCFVLLSPSMVSDTDKLDHSLHVESREWKKENIPLSSAICVHQWDPNMRFKLLKSIPQQWLEAPFGNFICKVMSSKVSLKRSIISLDPIYLRPFDCLWPMINFTAFLTIGLCLTSHISTFPSSMALAMPFMMETLAGQLRTVQPRTGLHV